MSTGYFMKKPATVKYPTPLIDISSLCVLFPHQIRQNINPMLNQGIISAFAAVRILSKVQIPDYCGFAPLDCK